MSPVPPPQGMSEVDYATIEAAVTETVRGRWFLNEFARRNRTAELQQLLEAMARIESVVAAGQAVLPPADPSIRLLMQRIKEIAGQLDTLSFEMRGAGVDERFAAAVEKEARAVSGMMRGPTLTGAAPVRPVPTLRKPDPPVPTQSARDVSEEPEAPTLNEPEMAAADNKTDHPTPEDPRLARLADLDRLSLMEKLALFA